MDEHNIEAKAIIDAKKETIVGKEAMQLVTSASKVFAAKGKKVVEFDLKAGKLQGDADEDELRKAIIGPSGNLRAPTLICGKTWLVGFHPEMYEHLL